MKKSGSWKCQESDLGKTKPGGKGDDYSCFMCGKPGHLPVNCTSHGEYLNAMADNFTDIAEVGDDGKYIITQNGAQMSSEGKDKTIDEHSFTPKEIRAINKDWLLFDSESTLNNLQPSLLIKYFKGGKITCMHCNAGTTSTNLRADYGTFTVWYNQHGNTSIFALHEVKFKY